MPQLDRLAGATFGPWLIVRRGHHHPKHTFWRCRCTCGTERDLRADVLTCLQSPHCRHSKPVTSRRSVWETPAEGEGTEPRLWLVRRKGAFAPRHPYTLADYDRAVDMRYRELLSMEAVTAVVGADRTTLWRWFQRYEADVAEGRVIIPQNQLRPPDLTDTQSMTTLEERPATPASTSPSPPKEKLRRPIDLSILGVL